MNERLRHEQHFHDEQAQERRQGWEANPALLRFPAEDYLDHEPWVRPALARLGNLQYKRVVDFGCGHGMASTSLARMGAHVIAFDLSSGYVHEAVCRAKSNQVAIEGVVADGAHLPFRDGSMDAIWGVAILHHLELTHAAKEIKRVLAPGGQAVFCEPWGGNQLLELARRYLPYAGKERTADERPLTADDLRQIQTVFPSAELQFVQLSGMIRRAWKNCPLLPMLDRLDGAILRHWLTLRPWCRYVVVHLIK
ncbi:MAG: class I SAM-dependent methyltransferase [Planctomycetia bacterium]|nr:class I SAM-dependent methyltransferase [Planctomycetia bacterium]